MLPDFIVIGAMKAGTTSLFGYLRTHPQVFLPWRKEIHFFSHDDNWEKGVHWYEDQFAGASPDQRIGEASPSYSKRHLFPDASDRLAKVLPTARIIYLVRDPITRLQSMYLDMLYYGGERRSLSQAVRSDDDYILTSSYGWQLEPYVERFGRERILVETSDQLRADPNAVLQRVFGFIGVDEMPPAEPIESNLSETKRIPNRLGRRLQRVRPSDRADPPTLRDRLLTRQSSLRAAALRPQLRTELEDVFGEDLRRLQQLVEVDLSAWNWLQDK